MNNLSAPSELSISVPVKCALPEVQQNFFTPVGKNEVRVKMMSMGYCGRDKSTVTGQKTAVPGRIGHEGAGVVVEMGSDVSDISIGENILVFPFIGKHNIGYDWPEGGKGIFSTYPVIPAEAIHKIGKKEITAKEWLKYSLVEPFSGVSRGLSRGKIQQRDWVVILGAGPIGCEQAILAKYLNPEIRVILADVSEIKLKLAQKVGVPADIFLSLSDLNKAEKFISEHSKRFGNILVIHSNPFKASIKQAFRFAPDNSALLFFSGIYDWDENDNRELGFRLNPKALHYEEYNETQALFVNYQGKQIELLGSRGFTRDDFVFSADLIIQNKINPLPIVTKVLLFDEDILENLKIEGEKEENIKILMTPHKDFTTII